MKRVFSLLVMVLPVAALAMPGTEAPRGCSSVEIFAFASSSIHHLGKPETLLKEPKASRKNPPVRIIDV
jgi:hypothetical protein